MKTIMLLVVILSVISCQKDILTENSPKKDSNDTLNIRIKWESSVSYYSDSLKISYGLHSLGLVPASGRMGFEFQINTDFIWRLEKVKNLNSKIKVSIYIHHGNIARVEGDSLVYQTTQTDNPITIKGKFTSSTFNSVK
jgi:hypothetical protein